jgi:hypothetical protein
LTIENVNSLQFMIFEWIVLSIMIIRAIVLENTCGGLWKNSYLNALSSDQCDPSRARRYINMCAWKTILKSQIRRQKEIKGPKCKTL